MFKLFIMIMVFSLSLFSKDLNYGNKDFQNMKIIEKNSSKIIFFVHGGAWLFGDKLKSVYDKDYLTNYTFVSVNYRLDGDINNQIEDISLALEKTKELYPTSEIILMGHSAGAHLILTTSIMKNYRNKLIILDTTYDYSDKFNGIYKAFEKYSKKEREALSPYWLNIRDKNMLIVSSKRNAKETEVFIEKNKYSNNIKYYPTEMTHKEINEILGTKENKEYDDIVIKYLNNP